MKSFDYFVLILGLFIGWLTTRGQKTQFVRLIDIFFYGPFLIYIALQFEDLLNRNILLFIGATTITYNLKNYNAELYKKILI
jgi:hypothetical protein